MADIVRYVDTSASPGGDGSISAPYDSLASWRTNEVGAIAAGDRHICNFRSDLAAPDPTYLNLNGFSGPGELVIRRWPGLGENDAILRPQGGNGHAIEVSTDGTLKTYLEDLFIDMDFMTGASEEGIRTIRDTEVRRCCICRGTEPNMDGIYTGFDSVSAVVYISDSQIFSMDRCAVVNQNGTNKGMVCTNLTIWDIRPKEARYPAIGHDNVYNSTGSFWFINIAAHVAAGSLGPCFSANASGGWVHPDSNKNISSDNSAPAIAGPNSIGNVTFQEGAGGSGDRIMLNSLTWPVDLHLFNDPANIAFDFGAGPDDTPTGSWVTLTDFDGDPRSGLTCDCGMDEYVDAGGGIFDEDITYSSIQTASFQAELEARADAQFDVAQTVAMDAALEAGLDAQFDAAQTMSFEAGVEVGADAQFDANSRFFSQTNLDAYPQIATNSHTTLTAEAFSELLGLVELDANAVLSGDALLDGVGDATIAAATQIIATIGDFTDVDINFSYDAGLSVDAMGEMLGDISVEAQQQVQTDALGEYLADIGVSAIADMIASALGEISAEIAIGVDADIETIAGIDIDGEVALSCHARFFSQAALFEITVNVPPGRTMALYFEKRKIGIYGENRTMRIMKDL